MYNLNGFIQAIKASRDLTCEEKLRAIRGVQRRYTELPTPEPEFASIDDLLLWAEQPEGEDFWMSVDSTIRHADSVVWW